MRRNGRWTEVEGQVPRANEAEKERPRIAQHSGVTAVTAVCGRICEYRQELEGNVPEHRARLETLPA